MGTYISLAAIQPPFDIGIDAQSRQMFSFNVLAKAAGDPTYFLEDMSSLLSTAGLGLPGVSLFIGGGGLVTQTGAGPFTQLIRTGGAGTTIDHAGGRLPILTFQVLVRAAAYWIAEAQAVACYRVLDGGYEITVPSAA